MRPHPTAIPPRQQHWHSLCQWHPIRGHLTLARSTSDDGPAGNDAGDPSETNGSNSDDSWGVGPDESGSESDSEDDIARQDTGGGEGPTGREGVASAQGGSKQMESEVAMAAAVLTAGKVAADGGSESTAAVRKSRRSTTRLSQGSILSLVLGLVLLSVLLVVDAYVWRLIRRPLAAFLLTIPFLFSALLSAALGSVAVPLLAQLRARQLLREEGPPSHAPKAGTPTMGGVFFVPVGVLVAWAASGAPPEIMGPSLATLGFMALGALDDGLSLVKKHNYGLPGKLKFLIQAAAGLAFFIWLDKTPLKHPYTWKLIVPLPLSLGLWYMGRLYLPLTVFTFTAMSNAVNLTDGLDGLAAGTCAAALTAMAVAVLPLYPALSIFGAAMAGACMGFLAHNSNPANVFMGDTGSLALGAALAAMASASGLFLPLFIASLLFAFEAFSVILQVLVFQVTKRFTGEGYRVFKMSPYHHHLELSGWSETSITAFFYFVALILAVASAYLGLISV